MIRSMWPRLRSHPVTIALFETWLQIAAWISSDTDLSWRKSTWEHSGPWANHFLKPFFARSPTPDTYLFSVGIMCRFGMCKNQFGIFFYFFFGDLVSGVGLMVLGLIWPCGFGTGNKDLQSEFALRHASVRWGAVIPTSEAFHLHPRNIL